MLFRRKIQRNCLYCVHATLLDEDTVLCIKHGARSAEKACQKFLYDPCKRTPPREKMPDFEKFDQNEFTL